MIKMVKINIKTGFPMKNDQCIGTVNFEDNVKISISGRKQIYLEFDKYELLDLKRFVLEKTLQRRRCKLGTIPKFLYFHDVSEFTKGGTVYYKESIFENKWNKSIVDKIYEEDGYMFLAK